MTDTEAKALFEVRQNLANAAITGGMKNVRPSVDAALDMLDTLTDLVIAAAQTEALHAAEMRELKERFSAACEEALDIPVVAQNAARILAHFIIPAPDPLVEAAQEAFSAMLRANSPDGLTEALRAAIEARGGKIVWEKTDA